MQNVNRQHSVGKSDVGEEESVGKVNDLALNGASLSASCKMFNLVIIYFYVDSYSISTHRY